MNPPCPQPPARTSAPRARRPARRAESFSGSIRQCLTPELWKPAPRAADAAGCRNDPRWALQPLIRTCALMTWCASPTEAERCLTARTCYGRVSCPQRKRPGTHFRGFPKARARLPMTVWWAVADAVRRPRERTLGERLGVDGGTAFGGDGTRLEGPRAQHLEDDLGRAGKPGSAPMLWVTARVRLRTGVPWSWRTGTARAGARRPLLDLREALPRAPRAPVLMVGDAGVIGSERIATVLGRGRSFLIRLSSPAQLYSEDGVEVSTFREGLFWSGTDRAEQAERPPLRVRVIRVARPKRKQDVGLVTDVLDPRRLSAQSAGRRYRMRWEREGFFQTYQRGVKDVRLVSETTVMVAREAEGALLACPLLLAHGAWALKSGRPRAGRDADNGSVAGVLREVRRGLKACAEPWPRASFRARWHGCGRDRGSRSSATVRKEHPRRKPHTMPKPPRLKVLNAAQRQRIAGLCLKDEAA